MRGQFWTDDMDLQLKSLWDTGLSCSLIAARMNCNVTRNAVIGRVHRLGLPGRGAGKHPPQEKKFREVRMRRSTAKVPVFRLMTGHVRPAPLMKPEEVTLRCAEIAPRGLSLVELETNDCRYPYGENPFVFCGHPKIGGSSYCIAHDRLTRTETRRALSREERLLKNREYMASYRAEKRMQMEAAE